LVFSPAISETGFVVVVVGVVVVVAVVVAARAEKAQRLKLMLY